ncbi:MAG: methyltransferase [Chitinophagaceae bacterium]|nr:methyltransferase [Chitinophagaceae bacterium]
MANNYFQFKQFTVQQEHCAMKVCTDACLFGAWVAEEVFNSTLKVKNALDIGTGTGVLSLMLAQKIKSTKIKAIEIDDSAAAQAKENFESSPWKSRLCVIGHSVQQFKSLTENKFDLIISNPPFFENDLKSEDQKRNLALHSEKLDLMELADTVQFLLHNQGFFAVLLPAQRVSEFEVLAKKGKLFLYKKVFVKQTPAHSPFRAMMIFLPYEIMQPEVKEIVIKKAEGNYTAEFIELLKDYYLYL